MITATETKKAPFVIVWRDGFKVNIPQVDQEHKHLFGLIGALSLQSVEKTVEELLDYVVTHFSNEQELMGKSRYPVYEDHLKLHEEFGAQVAEFLGSGEAWTEERMQALRRYLNKWLIGHIMTHDIRFGKWLEKKQFSRTQVVQETQEQKGFLSRLFGKR